jgi:hypothetical protein
MRSDEEIDMKRIAKRTLELDTQTIRRLAGADLAAAVGGSVGGPYVSDALCTYSQLGDCFASGNCLAPSAGGSHVGGPSVGGHNLE